ncbi:MAG: hypothetical protein JNM17_08140 [Archangium sp.]|nr:hypothetical protein [Archangium sp.]
MRTFFVAGCALLSVGCASLSNMQMADTLGRGNFQVGVETGTWSAASATVPISVSNGNPSFLPHVDVAARFGVSDGVDLGLRAGLSFLELQGKFLFTRPGDPHLAVSLAPTAGGLLLPGSGSAPVQGLLNIAVPVLIGIKTSGGSEFVIGPRLQNLILMSGTSTVYGLGAGVSLGFAIRFTDNFGLMPEASIVVPLVGASAFSSQTNTTSLTGDGLFLFQFKLGVLVGRFRSLQPPNNDLKQAPPPTIPPPGQVPISNQPLPPEGNEPPPPTPPQ